MEEIVKIAVDEYEKKPDGTWLCVKNSDVTTKTGRIIRIAPGNFFTPGKQFLNVDIAAALDAISGK